MKKYSAGIVSRPTFFRESIEVATLVNSGLEDKEIKRKLIDENYLKLPTPRRKKEISSAVFSRIKGLDAKEIEILVEGAIEEKKQLTLVSILKNDRLFLEFMIEVYLEKILLGQLDLKEADFNSFMRRKAEQSTDVAKWKDYTIYKIKQVYKRILEELGFIKSKDKDFEIVIPIVSESFKSAISNESAEIKRLFTRGQGI